MEKLAVKERRLNIRCNEHARELLNKAATYAQVSVSEFVLSNALVSAELLVQANESLTLKPKDFQAFLAALDQPVRSNPALKKAFARRARQVAR